jgi:hypothetical protein
MLCSAVLHCTMQCYGILMIFSFTFLHQMTSTNIKFKCKSWIDTFGQRSNKAAGSLVTNQFATSMVDLVNYGSFVGVVTATFLIWVSHYMGR